MKILSMHVENFLSFEEADFDFDRVGLVLIEGENRDDPTARSNGSGKSAVIDALVWCLFGVTLRGYSHDEVVHRRVGEGCAVTVYLRDRDSEWSVTRARRHKRLKNSLSIEDQSGVGFCWPSEKETQAEIERRIGCTARAFLSSVVFGQDRAYRFSSLGDAEQKKILDEVIGVERFAAAGASARRVASALQVEVDTSRRMLKRVDEDRDALADEVASLKAKDADFVEAQFEKIKAEREKLRDVTAQLSYARRYRDQAKLKGDVDAALIALAAAEKSYEEALEADASANADADRGFSVVRDASDVIKVRRKLRGDCPTCGQKVDDARHARVLADLSSELARHKGEHLSLLATATAARNALAQHKQDLKDARDRVAAAHAAVNAEASSHVQLAELRRRKVEIESRIAELEAEVSPFAELADKAQARYEERLAVGNELRSQVAEVEVKLGHASFWVKAFGAAGLRSLLIDSSLPLLNEEAARVSRAVTGGSISVAFSATTEQKSGKVVDRFEVRVDNRHGAGSYSGNSSGERAKVDLCVGLALQRLVASRGSASFNVAFYDEVFDHLDAGAHERVVGVLAELDKDSVFVVSHDEGLKAWFPSTIRIVKQRGFSRVEI